MSVNIYDPNTDTLTKVAGRGEVPGNVITSDSFKSGNSTTETHDANEMTTNGVYYYTSNGPDSSVGATSTDGAMFVQAYNDTWVAQIAQDYRTGKAFFRGRNNGTWTAWQAFKTQADVDSAYSSGRTQGQADRDEGVTLDSESRLLSDYKARTSDGTLVTGNIASKSSGESCTHYGVDSIGPFVYFAAGYYPSVNSYGAYVRLTAAQIKAMANSAGVGYNAGVAAVKASPNSYGLYTAAQYNAHDIKHTVKVLYQRQRWTSDSASSGVLIQVRLYKDSSQIWNIGPFYPAGSGVQPEYSGTYTV